MVIITEFRRDQWYPFHHQQWLQAYFYPSEWNNLLPLQWFFRFSKLRCSCIYHRDQKNQSI